MINEITNIDKMSIDEFASRAASAATRMGLERTRNLLLDVLERFGPDKVVMSAATQMAQSASDTYSGRTNDLQRAYNDGVRRICGRIIDDALQFGEPPTEKSISRIN